MVDVSFLCSERAHRKAHTPPRCEIAQASIGLEVKLESSNC